MTTREFINKQFGNNDGKERFCSSVFKTGNGDVYSYGYHYPLLFTVAGKVFRNTSGYSNSTAKHINWTRDIDAIDVELSGCNQYSWRNPENANRVPALLSLRRYRDADMHDNELLRAIRQDLIDHRDRVQAQMASKKRKDTQVYKSLEWELSRVVTSIERMG